MASSFWDGALHAMGECVAFSLLRIRITPRELDRTRGIPWSLPRSALGRHRSDTPACGGSLPELKRTFRSRLGRSDSILFSSPPYGEPRTHPGQHPRQHHAVLADGHRRLGRPLVLGVRTSPGRRPGSPAGRGPGRLHDVPRRGLRCPAQLGRGGLPRPRLLQRGRQGRPLRCLGRAGALLHRNAGRIQLTALTTPVPPLGRAAEPPWFGDPADSAGSRRWGSTLSNRRRDERRSPVP